MIRNTSSLVLLISGWETVSKVSISGARWWSISTFLAGDESSVGCISITLDEVLKSRQKTNSAWANASSRTSLCLSYRFTFSTPGIHLRKSGKASGTTTNGSLPLCLRYSAHPSMEPRASPSGLLWQHSTMRWESSINWLSNST